MLIPLNADARSICNMSKVETRIEKRELRELKPSDTNARRMSRFMYERLVENLRADGDLTSTPLVHEYKDGTTRIVSGHHRIRAAMEAGITHAKVMNITSPISEEHLTALQLSHNSLSGEDDPEILKEMLEELSAEEQVFSAITIAEPPEMPSFGPSIATPKPVKLEVSFLEPELHQMRNIADRITASKQGATYQLERLDSLDEFISMWLRVKDETQDLADDGHVNMLGKPETLMTMARLAGKALDSGMKVD